MSAALKNSCLKVKAVCISEMEICTKANGKKASSMALVNSSTTVAHSGQALSKIISERSRGLSMVM